MADTSLLAATPLLAKGQGSLLAAMAVEPRLSSLVLFDATQAQLEHAARILAAFLEIVNRPARVVRLAAYHDEDDLWGVGSELPASWRRPGLLVPDPAGDLSWRIVVIPDLAAVNLAAARACVRMVGAERAHLERHGQSVGWQPRLVWLARCSRRDVGRVSPHLLDRFLLRHVAAPPEVSRHIPELRTFLADIASVDSEDVPADGPEPRDVDRLRATMAAMPPRLSDTMLERVRATLERHPSPGLRRHLALSRLATTLARMDAGGAEVEEHHLDEAARLLGIEPLRRRDPDPSAEAGSDSAPSTAPKPAAREEPTPLPEELPRPRPRPVPTRSPAAAEPLRAEVPGTQTETAVEVSLSPYPEDDAPPERDFASLTFPLARGAARPQGQGTPIGVRRATSLEDLALVATLFAAAPFQPIRRRHLERDPRDTRLILTVDDLRAWRRAPTADEMLALLLDVTSFGDSDWSMALVPWVRAAYVNRAALCLVIVGAEGHDELRAERLRARSVLTPELRDAFERRPGCATPLAHGLDRMFDTLRQALRQGRGTVRRVELVVVVSDGRGNVPLAASREGRLDGPVGREGVADALGIARQIAELDDVESVVLDPQPRYAAHLTRALADALGARLEPIPPRDTEETGP